MGSEEFYATSDGGITWHAVPGARGVSSCAAHAAGGPMASRYLNRPPQVAIEARQVDGPDAAWMAAGSLLYVTSDAGAQWVRIAFPGTVSPSQASFPNPEDGWFLSGGQLFATTDGGRQWVQVA